MVTKAKKSAKKTPGRPARRKRQVPGFGSAPTTAFDQDFALSNLPPTIGPGELLEQYRTGAIDGLTYLLQIPLPPGTSYTASYRRESGHEDAQGLVFSHRGVKLTADVYFDVRRVAALAGPGRYSAAFTYMAPSAKFPAGILRHVSFQLTPEYCAEVLANASEEERTEWRRVVDGEPGKGNGNGHTARNGQGNETTIMLQHLMSRNAELERKGADAQAQMFDKMLQLFTIMQPKAQDSISIRDILSMQKADTTDRLSMFEKIMEANVRAVKAENSTDILPIGHELVKALAVPEVVAGVVDFIGAISDRIVGTEEPSTHTVTVESRQVDQVDQVDQATNKPQLTTNEKSRGLENARDVARTVIAAWESDVPPLGIAEDIHTKLGADIREQMKTVPLDDLRLNIAGLAGRKLPVIFSKYLGEIRECLLKFEAPPSPKEPPEPVS